MYIGVWSAEHNYDQKDAGNLRDLLKSEGVRAKLGHSCYVGHKSVEVHILDLLKASAALLKHTQSRDEFDSNRYIAKCCREKYRENKELARRVRADLAKKGKRSKRTA